MWFVINVYSKILNAWWWHRGRLSYGSHRKRWKIYNKDKGQHTLYDLEYAWPLLLSNKRGSPNANNSNNRMVGSYLMGI